MRAWLLGIEWPDDSLSLRARLSGLEFRGLGFADLALPYLSRTARNNHTFSWLFPEFASFQLQRVWNPDNSKILSVVFYKGIAVSHGKETYQPSLLFSIDLRLPWEPFLRSSLPTQNPGRILPRQLWKYKHFGCSQSFAAR